MFSEMIKQMFKKQSSKEHILTKNKSFMDLSFDVKYDVKDCSPNLKNLHNRSPKVKRLSKVFDKDALEFHNKCNWWLDNVTPPRKKRTALQYSTPSLLLDILEPNEDLDIDYSIKKLQQLEQNYVNELQFAMDNYVQVVDDSIYWKNKTFRWQKQQLFGNLRKIYKFHKYNFQPRLLGCGDDVEKLAQLFISSVDHGSFYCYVSHAMVEKSAEKWRNWYRKIFDQFYTKCGRGYYFHPMDHLVGYKKLIHKISTKLHKSFDANFQLIVTLFSAETSLQNLIDQVSNASFVERIVEVREVLMNVHMEVKAMVEETEESIDLFLVPREDCFYGYRQPINIMKLGRFIKLEKVTMRSSDYVGSHESHFFVFERCLIYTVAVGDNFLFTGNFWLKSTQVGFIYDCSSGVDLISLRDRYRTVVLETPGLFDLIKELKDKSDKEPYVIPKIYLSEKQLKKLFKMIG